MSYWHASSHMPRFPKLAENLKVDVVIVGGGIMGITAAYLLKKSGKTVALLERDRCAHGDTGRTTAHLTCVTDERLSHLVRTLGEDHARAVWDAGLAAINQIDEIIQREEIACNFHRLPGYLHQSIVNAHPTDADSFREEADLARKLGFDADFVEKIPLFHLAGMQVANQAIFHPLKYLRGLAEKIPGNGSHIFEFSNADEFLTSPMAVKSNNHTITCSHIVIATHVPLMGNNGLVSATLFQTKLAPYSSYAIGGKIPKGSQPAASFWDTSDPYYYLRIEPHAQYDYVIFGGEDHKTGQVTDTEPHYKALKRILQNHIKGVDIDQQWSGQVIETHDGLPLIGELGEKQFIGTGFAGNGMTFGTLAAMMAADAIHGRKNPWQKLFDVHRKNILGGAWDYIKENIDYPYYLIKDRLSRAQGDQLQDVPRGEGRILRIDGQRLAVHRSDEGKLSVVSAICTHMGCVVHWNGAEKTWDCPCHGSRFRCNGEVIAGPAETPLEKHDPAETKSKQDKQSPK